MNFKQNIIKYAKELGFIDLKFTPVQVLSKEIKLYKQWIDSGFNADMKWMERNIDKRENIKLILSEAKTVIVAAHSYFTGINYPDELNGFGKISRYAWGDDYHDVVLNKLKMIEKYIADINENAVFKSYVDTGPILEKQWAVKSGLGWQGKNGMIINPKYGSYFFLGIIITNLEIEPDVPLKEMCGTCDKCIQACPTKAIIHPKVIDSNKCLSYWTIESKDDKMPEEFAKNQNNWIFGCDICQEVCPWNKFSIPTSEEAFLPRNGETILSKKYIYNLDDETFRARFNKSPIKRAKLKGMKKNFS